MYRRNPVPMEPLGQVAQQGVLGIGRDGLDDQPIPCDTEDDGVAFAEHGVQPAGEPLGRILQVRVSGRVHRALMQNNGKLDQEVGELAG